MMTVFLSVLQKAYIKSIKRNQCSPTFEINSYNALNQLTNTISDNMEADYFYNSDGLRISKKVNGNTTNHVWDGDQMVLETDGAGNVTNKYIRGINLIYSEDSGANRRYFLYNGHGDTVQLTSTTGSSIKTYDYDAFGNEKNPDPNDTNMFRYCGEYFDKETGTIYLRARYYDPTIGRFITEDSVCGISNEMPNGQEIIDVLSLNLYTYTSNNPILFIDPSGHVIELSSTATKEEKKQYERTIAYLKTSKTGKELLKKLEDSKTVFTIMFVNNDNDYFDSSTKNIYWDIDSGLVMKDGTSIQSAALGLAHEMGHGAQYLDGDLDEMLNAKTQAEADTARAKIEAANLKNCETPIAKQLGEPIRKSYLDASGVYTMNNSTHYRTTHSYSWYQFWKWGKHYTKDHNAK